ncbi:MAG: hypothetical protein P4L70_00610, partial [Parasulfuritortus sp.]|nr:hypothetical protein [Parasulfuritortus sp.]
ILTIKSQAALGCGGTCFTPSRSLSKNTSLSHKKNVGTCSGYSPSYYLPANPKTSFCSIFADPQNKYKTKKCLNKSCSSYQLVSMTFADVLKKGPSDPAYYVVGAYLNIQKNLVAPQALTGPQLVTMWNDCAKYGKHEVMANVYWNIGQVNSYLCNSNITAD